MKHLRKFNESKDYYEEIDHDNYIYFRKDFLKKEVVEFDQKYIDILKTILRDDIVSISNIKKQYLMINDDIYIFQLDDEWFIIYNGYNEKEYKCDQFEGVLEYFKDNLEWLLK
jgi:hypothetical protein